jgi:carbamoyl-phosphate synthase large subunit
VFLSVKDRDKKSVTDVARELAEMGFELYATSGTASVVTAAGIGVKTLKKLQEGHPNVADMIHAGELALVINTPSGDKPRQDEIVIRSLAVSRGVPCVTTIEGAMASIRGIRAVKSGPLDACSLQAWHVKLAGRPARAAATLSA